MQFDVSYGRHKGPRAPLTPSLVTISPGWWRVECGRLAVEVDDQPTSGTTYAILTAAAAVTLWSIL